jgi:signal transduction histidine kinase
MSSTTMSRMSSTTAAGEHARQIRAFVHEFNNLFLAIGGHCELLVEQTLPASQARADLLAIADATERAAALASRLRTHALEYAREAAGDRVQSPASTDVG